KERIRRSVHKLKAETQESLLQAVAQDPGFRVFKLTASNLRRWQAQTDQSTPGLLLQIEQQAQTPLVAGAKQTDVLIELALLEGFALSVRQTQAAEFARNRVMCLTD